VGETKQHAQRLGLSARTFSILERIDVGETYVPVVYVDGGRAFSILERIDVGETWTECRTFRCSYGIFQYPRTDRRG